MSVVYHYPTRQELLDERAAIIREWGMDEHDFKRLAEIYPLDFDQSSTASRLESISFLLGEWP